MDKTWMFVRAWRGISLFVWIGVFVFGTFLSPRWRQGPGGFDCLHNRDGAGFVRGGCSRRPNRHHSD